MLVQVKQSLTFTTEDHWMYRIPFAKPIPLIHFISHSLYFPSSLNSFHVIFYLFILILSQFYLHVLSYIAITSLHLIPICIQSVHIQQMFNALHFHISYLTHKFFHNGLRTEPESLFSPFM